MKNIAGLIYAGGQSRRFGENKAEVVVEDKRLIDHVVTRFRPQVTALAIAGPITVPDTVCLRDEPHRGKGPLAGLHAGLKWASALPNVEWLATTPCDVPLLPIDLVIHLSDGLADKPRVLRIEDQWQTGCALWPVTSSRTIEEILIAAADLSLHTALRSLGAEQVDTQQSLLDGSFLNINTRADLAAYKQEGGTAHG